jgi:hypothetical protein
MNRLTWIRFIARRPDSWFTQCLHILLALSAFCIPIKQTIAQEIKSLDKTVMEFRELGSHHPQQIGH